ncbi:MAG: hypothetical protein AB1489_10785, partial [Acidobacteriota bacterium]
MWVNLIKILFNIFQKTKRISLRLRHIAERRGLWAIFCYVFFGSLILPIPIDSMLSALIASSPRRWLRLTFTFAFASVVGGVATYCIGYGFVDLIGQHLIELCGGQSAWQSLVTLFQSERGATYLATVSLLVGPYKLSTLAAGATGMKFSLLVMILLFTRTSRFIIIGVL